MIYRFEKIEIRIVLFSRMSEIISSTAPKTHSTVRTRLIVELIFSTTPSGTITSFTPFILRSSATSSSICSALTTAPSSNTS